MGKVTIKKIKKLLIVTENSKKKKNPTSAWKRHDEVRSQLSAK